ncbi:unnamed protein product, partial [Rotaria sp. Silwood2]
SINFTNNKPLPPIIEFSIKNLLGPTYVAFKSIKPIYLRAIIGPSILLNSLCLFIFSRQRLSNKSTTIIFLRVLALFDILSIILKYIREEINYQSTEKGHEIFFMTSSACKTLYVLMNTCSSISMWIIALMSLDKAIAVSYPLKSSVITAANIIIVVVLHRTSYDWRTSNDSNKRESDLSVRKKKLLKPSLRQSCSGTSTTTAAELVLATKRRTNAQVTRMLLAVTLSVIIFNIPNTIFYVGLLIFGEKAYLHNRSFVNMSKDNIVLGILNIITDNVTAKSIRV